jgi:hypothetical protein
MPQLIDDIVASVGLKRADFNVVRLSVRSQKLAAQKYIQAASPKGLMAASGLNFWMNGSMERLGSTVRRILYPMSLDLIIAFKADTRSTRWKDNGIRCCACPSLDFGHRERGMSLTMISRGLMLTDYIRHEGHLHSTMRLWYPSRSRARRRYPCYSKFAPSAPLTGDLRYSLQGKGYPDFATLHFLRLVGDSFPRQVLL